MTRVPSQRHTLGLDRYRIGLPVSSADAIDVATLMAYCQGRGKTLIPVTWIRGTIAQGATRSLRFRVPRTSTARARRWVAQFSCDTGSCAFTAGMDTSTARELIVTGSAPSGYDTAGGRLQGWTAVQPIAAAAASDPDDAVFAVTNNSSEQQSRDLRLEWLACFEIDRDVLAPGDVPGIADVGTLFPGEIVYDSDPDKDSYLALNTGARGGIDARRAGLFHKAFFGESPISTTSTDAVTITNAPIVPARVAFGAANTTITVAIRARVTGGTGQVAASTSAGSVTANVTSTSLAWHTLSVLCPAEDLSTVDGLPSATWPLLTVTMTAPSSQTIELVTVSAFRLRDSGAIV